jgi:GxxExxY protein
MAELLLKEEVYAIVVAAMDVYNHLGSGFLEPVYQEALALELARRHIPFEAQKELDIWYRGQRLQKTYFADFRAFDKIVIEIKALDRLTGNEEGQLLNYLKASGMEVGLLINFGSARKLEWKRMIRTETPAVQGATRRTAFP